MKFDHDTMISKITAAHIAKTGKTSITLQNTDFKTIGIIKNIQCLKSMSDNEFLRFIMWIKNKELKAFICKYKDYIFIVDNQLYILVDHYKVTRYIETYHDFIMSLENIQGITPIYYNNQEV